MRFVRFAAVMLCVVSVLAFSGCGNKDKDYRKTTGTVTMDGQPVEGASVVFYAKMAGGEGGAALTDATGVYTATSSGAQNGGVGLKPGEYTVTICKYEKVVDEDQEAYDKGEITYDELQERKAKAGAYAKTAAPKLLTPQKYSTTNSTPLTITVTDDAKANVFDFNLDE